jgi:hypothetical protein
MTSMHDRNAEMTPPLIPLLGKSGKPGADLSALEPRSGGLGKSGAHGSIPAAPEPQLVGLAKPGAHLTDLDALDAAWIAAHAVDDYA